MEHAKRNEIAHAVLMPLSLPNGAVHKWHLTSLDYGNILEL